MSDAEIATLRAKNASMLASLAQATAAVNNMAVEGRAVEIRLNQVEAQSRRANVQYDAVYTMSRAKVRISPRSWAPHKCLRSF